MHPDLLREPVSLPAVAGCAGGDDVLPYRLTAAAARDHVVHGQARPVGAAVLAGPAVSGEHRLAGDPAPVDVPGDADEADQPDHLWPVEPHRLRAEDAVTLLEH